MRLENTAFDDVKLIHSEVYPDARGSFAEHYSLSSFHDLGIDTEFVHDSWSFSAKAGTVRGLHFQVPPKAQDKLVRVTRGRVFDVIVDLRRRSENFGKHISLELDAEAIMAVFIPAGFAHGFCSLTDDVEITYKMSDEFSPDHYQGIRWNDPALKIEWPVDDGSAIVSDKDSNLPIMENFASPF